MNNIIFLDLETTGTNPETNEIIEIGAVKLVSGEQQVFDSLVKPREEVPYYITRLTGISSDQLRNAPSFSHVRAGLTEFLGDSILVGHNLSFDLGFLAAAGLILENPTFDTLDISRLLFPNLPEYSLSFLSSYFEIEHLPKHRALDDAIATLQVFNRLKNKATSLNKEELEQVMRLFPVTGWSFIRIFQEVYMAKAWDTKQSGLKRKPPHHSQDENPKTEAEKRTPASLDNKKIGSLFKPGSPLGKSFSAFENRPGQIQMAFMVNQAFLNKRHLLAEAGTGTGKSVAYLLPSSFLSSSEHKPVVISTNTINLQEQLINKDIPGLTQIPDLQGLKVAHLKGRTNYICLRRWKNLFADRNISQDEARLALRIFLWMKESKNGDRGEIQLRWEEEDAWKRMCSTETDCMGESCFYKRNRDCFFYGARSKAEKSNLLVINHALLISNMAAGGGVLPDFDYLVIDEAHHLEDVATDHLGFRLKERDIREFLEELKRALYAYSKGDKDDSKKTPEGDGRQIKGEVNSQGSFVLRYVADLNKEVSRFYVKIKEFVQSNTQGPEEYEQKIRLVPRLRSTPGWRNIINPCESLVQSLEILEKEMEKLLFMIEALPENSRGESYRTLPGLLKRGQEIRGQISSFVLSPTEELISWSSVNQGDAALCAAPLSVCDPLQSHLFAERSSIILTSATLCSGGDFNYIQSRLGLAEVEKVSIPSPFDYSGNCLVTVAEDMPEPDKRNYQESLEAALKAICLATRGRTLVLFTAHNMLRSLRNRLQPVLDKEGTLILAQGVDGSAKHLLAQFRAQENTILFGTSSFWEGVDVVGDALSVLVIVKLPFPVPSDPVIAARGESYEDPFREYSVPLAILKFKQGFGRLIRSQSDRGVMVVLDSRLKSKFYGRAFLEALPVCTKKYTPVRDIPGEIKTWLGWG